MPLGRKGAESASTGEDLAFVATDMPANRCVAEPKGRAQCRIGAAAMERALQGPRAVRVSQLAVPLLPNTPYERSKKIALA